MLIEWKKITERQVDKMTITMNNAQLYTMYDMVQGTVCDMVHDTENNFTRSVVLSALPR